MATAMLSLLPMAFLPLVPPSPLACEPVSLSPLTLTGLNLSLVPLSLHFSPGLCALCRGSHLLRLPSAPRRPVSLICPLILSGGILLVPSLSNDFLVRSPQFSKQFKPSHQHSGISALVWDSSPNCQLSLRRAHSVADYAPGSSEDRCPLHSEGQVPS